jgi:hypothetical protein
MNMAAFVSLEDISVALPPYNEEVAAVEMDRVLAKAYSKLEEDIADALREHHGNWSVISTAMNALLLYPDRPDLERCTGLRRTKRRASGRGS